MPRNHPHARCRDCKRPRAFPNEMSARGYCPDCGQRRREENIRQLIAHNGPWFRHWQRQCAEAFRYVLVDDLPQER